MNPQVDGLADELEALTPLHREHYEVARGLKAWFSRAEFLVAYQERYPDRAIGSILPSDYCYDRENKGNTEHPRFLDWDPDRGYLCLGLGGRLKAKVLRAVTFLNKVGVRATYGAVAEYAGTSAQAVGQSLGVRRPEASWVVNKETGLPSGYSTDETDPRLQGSGLIICSGEELKRQLDG